MIAIRHIVRINLQETLMKVCTPT